MIIEFFLSLLILCLTLIMCTFTSGAIVQAFIEPALLFGVLAILALMIFLSGYGKSFLKIFSSSKKIKETGLFDLKKIETALAFAFKALALISFFFVLIAGIYFYLNLFEKQTLGYNLATVFNALLYFAFLGILLLVLKGKLKVRIINFMAEETEPEKSIGLSKNQIALCTVKIIISLALIAAIYYLIVLTSMVNNTGSEPLSFYYLHDIPGLIYIFIPSFVLLAISGNFKIFFKAVGYAAKNTKLSVAQKAVSVNAIQVMRSILLFEGLMCALVGYMGIMCNLEDKSMLGTNFTIASVPLIYGLLLNLILLPVESKISLLGDAE